MKVIHTCYTRPFEREERVKIRYSNMQTLSLHDWWLTDCKWCYSTPTLLLTLC
jgi:hypothetical protein